MRARGSSVARLAARAGIGIGLGLGLGMGLAACHPRPTPPAPTVRPTEPVEPAKPVETTQAVEPPEPVEPAPCGPIDERFDDHAWLPAAATTVASVQLDAADLEATLRALGEHARAPGHGLAIPLSFSLGQWSWQVPVLTATLRRAGFRPAELVFSSDDASDHAWMWRSTCDLDETIERIEAAWSVRSRRVVDGVVATDPTGAFPYDVLMLSGERMALVPAGRASAVLARWGPAPPSAGLGGAPRSTAGRRLDDLQPATVRLVFLGRALLEPGAATTEHAPQTLRITGEGVRVPPDPAASGSLTPAP